MTFTKMVGTGNDFVIVDHRRKRWENSTLVQLAKRLTHRQNGVGADGILFLEKAHPGTKADFRMRIFNPDGSQAQMCGNGIRCLAYYAYQRRLAPPRMKIETLAGLIEAEIKPDHRVRVRLPVPVQWRSNLSFQKDGQLLKGSFVNTGVPHIVFFVDDLEAIDVERLGVFIRYHKAFAPAGTNVNFAKADDRHKVEVRTYERGVEKETLACGTGATAAALVAAQQGKVTSPVEVSTRGGGVLLVDFVREKNTITKVWLEGAVKTVFKGVINYV